VRRWGASGAGGCCNTQLLEKPERFQEQQGTGYRLAHDILELA
jgi:hypothetical protein